MAGAFLTNVAVNLVSKLGECLLAPIGRQFGYVLCYKCHVKDLENGVNELETARERVQRSVDAARYNGKSIYTDVQKWLTSVQKEAEEAKELLKQGESAKNACFRGWLPNPMVRHPIGRKVKKMTQVIQGLHENSQKTDFQTVFYEDTPIGIVTAARSVDKKEDVLESRASITEDEMKAIARSVDKKEDVLESRASITEDVMKAIVNDKACVIGVYGPGGVGKSKLMEDIEGRVKKEKLFDVVAKANVSRNPDLKRIQAEIAYALGLKLTNEETARGRADLLSKRLKSDSKKKILIIFDNLWKKLDLKQVGIPCGDNNRVIDCKLLLTSRYRDVLRIDMGSDRLLQLNELEHGEARRLFERTIGDKFNDPEFKPMVDGVVQKCGGLPLLICSVANRLKDGDLVKWRNALTDIEGSDVVELNYNDLKDERIKSLFLICALTSGGIYVRDSLVYCMGFGLFKKFSKTIRHARDRLIEDLHCLQDSSLLLDSDDTELFRMHDIFVDEAISIASTKWNALVGTNDRGFKEWSNDELRKCTVMSFPYVGIDELRGEIECPNLEMLLLLQNNSSLKMPESFFESMEKLHVLDMTGLSFMSLPSSIEFLENLKSLCLDFCYLEDVTILGKLKGLQFLSFLNSTITRLPKEIGGLTELRFLDLTGCTWLKVIEPGVLRSLINLEELYMEDSFDQWEAEDEALQSNASLAELKNMKKLSTLYIAIPHSASISRDLPCWNLNQHKIQIGDVWHWGGEYKESRTLKLKLDSANIFLEEWVQRCLQTTQDLHLHGLQDGNNSIHDLCIEGYQELKHLHVQNSPSLQYVVHSTENVQCTAFTRMESLFLEKLNNLEKICCGCFCLESFKKLKIVKVDNCGKIKHLFPLSMMRVFLQLEEIEISGCHLMQHIIANVEADEDGDEIQVDPIVKSYNLRKITLRNLSKMTSFSRTVDHSVVFFDKQQLLKLQNLEAIIVERCHLVRKLFNLEGLAASSDVKILLQLTRLILIDLPSLESIWNKNPKGPMCFRNLRVLKVQNCENLKFLFSSSMAKSLVYIMEIEIASCALMEEIVDVQEEESKEAATIDNLEFPLLTSLSLVKLPKLRTFSYEKCSLHCPSLTRLTVSGCPKMMTFFSFEGRQKSMMADTSSRKGFGHINSNLYFPGFFNEKVLFPSLEELKLSSMCQLKKIWHNQLHEQSFCKLASLTVELCENLLNVFPTNSLDRLQRLNKIEVVGCHSLEALFEPLSLSNQKRQKPFILSALEKIKMLNLPGLRYILKSDCKVTLAFPSLIEVNVRRCHSLLHLFSSATAKTLDKLAVLDVSCCNNLRGIIAMEERKGKTIETFKFRHLSTIKLGDLENLVSFSSVSSPGDELHPLFDEKFAFPKLEELHIEKVKQKELWNDKILVESFCRLKVLKVKQCHNLMNVIPSFMQKRLLHCMESLTVEKCPCLRNLFPTSVAKSLGQLQYLGLGGCEEMEYILAREEERSQEVADKIVIPRLVTLYLHNMPKLRSFCHGKHISEWFSLKELIVEDCKAVEVILGDASCKQPEGSIPTQQPLLLVEKVDFPNMESIRISHLDNVEKIWLGELALNAFGKLKMLAVEHCQRLLSIFSSQTILTRFQNLEELIVTNCDSLEVVFQGQELNMSGAYSTSTFQLRELNLERLPKMKHVWSGHSHGTLTFERLQCLMAIECQSLKILFPSLVAKSMTQLEELSVSSCGVEEIIAEEDEGVGTSASDLFFPRLTSLRFHELSELRSFCRNSHTSTWPFLKELKVMHCNKLRSFSLAHEIQSYQGSTTGMNQPALFSVEKVVPHLEQLTLTKEDVMMMQQQYLFSNIRELALSCYHDENVTFPSDFLLQRFPNLEHFILSCSPSEEILLEDVVGLIDTQKPFKALGNLKRLSLADLSNLRQVWKDGSFMAEILKQIESLNLMSCPSLSIVFPSLTSFQSLTELMVQDCAGLVHMGTCLAMTSLVHLTQLILRDCGAMEDVVTNDGHEVKEISFPKLEVMILHGLPSLESFSSINCAFMFPSLMRIVITKCPKMNVFCNGALWTPNLEKVLLSDEDDEGPWEGDLNTTIQILLT